MKGKERKTCTIGNHTTAFLLERKEEKKKEGDENDFPLERKDKKGRKKDK